MSTDASERQRASGHAACDWRELFEERGGRFGDDGARREDRRRSGLAQLVDVLWRDHPTDDDEDVAASELGERRLELGYQRQVAGGQRRHADDVHVGLDSLAGDLGWRLEQRPDVDVEPEVGERRGDDLLAAVVTVLADLGDEDPRLSAVIDGELLDERPHLGDVGRVADLLAVHAANRTDRRRVAAEHRLHRRRDLADRRVGSGGGDRQGQQVVPGVASRARRRPAGRRR